MGSFKQISIAALCVGAAIAFGNFVNHTPGDPVVLDVGESGATDTGVTGLGSRVAVDALDRAGQRPAAISTMRHRAKPDFSFPESEPSEAKRELHSLPPPSQLAGDNVAAKIERAQFAPPSSLPNDLEVPDFSAIAAALDNTPIELAPLGTMPTLERKTRPVSTPTTVPIGRRPATVGQVENRMRSRPLQSDAANVQPQIETAEPYQVVERPIGFTSSDFDASLRDGAMTGSMTGSMNGARTVGGLAETATSPTGNISSLLPIQTIEFAGANRTMAPLKSRFGDQVADSETGRVANAELNDGSRSTGMHPVELARSGIPPATNRVRTMLPFGLSEGAKTELVQLRSRATSNLALETTQFVDHIVQPGETLQSISQRYFGTPDYYLDIYLANRGKMKNPSTVTSGKMVRIPVYGK